MNFTTQIGKLRLVAFLEGWSLIILLFVAMPMKYLLDMPQGVQVIGMIHGLLFIGFLVQTLICTIDFKWKWFKEPFWLMVACILPFGTFVADKKILLPFQEKQKLQNID